MLASIKGALPTGGCMEERDVRLRFSAEERLISA
jgi:hypothetical protein